MNNLLHILFGFDKKQHKVLTELLAGLTTFIAMAYILVVNPSMLKVIGMDEGAAFTATLLAAVVGTLLCAIYAKLPYVQAPAMGPNAFFAFTICLSMGYSWQFALTGVLIEGILFIILSVTRVREWLAKLIPESIKIALGIGVGIFIAMLGLTNAHVIIADTGTIVGLGDIAHGEALLAILGILITAILSVRRIPGSLLIGIIITTLIGIPLGVTKMPEHWVSLPPSLSPVFCQFDFSQVLSLDMLIVVLTMLSMDIFDTLGTILALTSKTGQLPPKTFNRALMCDALATTIGAVLGTTTVGTYVESSVGMAYGGKTGLTSFTTAMLLLLCLFFAPIFLIIPAAAIAPALFLVGVGMMYMFRQLLIKDDPTELIPAILTILIIPFTFSIANGIIFGLLSYCVINLFTSGFKKLSWPMLILTALLMLKFFI